MNKTAKCSAPDRQDIPVQGSRGALTVALIIKEIIIRDMVKPSEMHRPLALTGIRIHAKTQGQKKQKKLLAY